MNFKKLKKEYLAIITLIIVVTLVSLIIISSINKNNNPKTEPKVPIIKNTGGIQSNKKPSKYLNLGKIYDASNFVINSQEIILSLEKKDFSAKEIFGNSEKFFGDEIVYQDRAIRAKDSFGKLNYLVFTKNYPFEIINGVKLTDTKEEIESKLGIKLNKEELGVTLQTNKYAIYLSPVFKSAVFFPNYETDIKKMAELLKELVESKDYKRIIPEITKEYPMYTDYQYGENYIKLTYPTLGIRIVSEFESKRKSHEVNIYGNIPNLIEIEEMLKSLKKNSEIINIYEEDAVKIDAVEILNKFELLLEGLAEQEDNIVMLSREEETNEEKINNYTKCIVVPQNSKIEPYNLNKAGVCDDYIIIGEYIYYSLNNEGIYRINGNTGITEFVKKEKGVIRFEKFENGYIKYNNGYIKI